MQVKKLLLKPPLHSLIKSVHSDSQKTNFLNYYLYFQAMQIIWLLYFQGLCIAVHEISAVNLIV